MRRRIYEMIEKGEQEDKISLWVCETFSVK